jgi:peptide/nickel transport system permease protein
MTDAVTENGRRGLSAPLLRRLKALATVILSLAVTMLGLLLVTFVIGRVMPIDPVLSVVGERATTEIYQRVYLEMGLDKPIVVQFGLYIRDVLTGDFGMSLLTARPVSDDIVRVFPATLELATIGVIIGIIFGVPMGVMAAVHQGRLPDHFVRLFGLFGYSMPIFWIALIGLLVFYGILGWVGGPGRLDIFYVDMIPSVTGMILVDSLIAGDMTIFWNAVNHIVLPASILGYYSMAYNPQLHAGGTGQGVYYHGAGQGPVRAGRDLAPCAG